MKTVCSLAFTCGLILAGSSWSVQAATAIELTLNEPNHNRLKIELSSTRTLRYVKLDRQKWTRTRKDVTPELATQLSEILLNGKLPISKWKSDTECFREKTWSLRVDATRYRICKSETEISILQDFTRAVQMVMRPD